MQVPITHKSGWLPLHTSRCNQLNKQALRVNATTGVERQNAQPEKQLQEKHNGKTAVFKYDDQKRIVLPRIPDKAIYYSRQLYMHNVMVCQGHSKSPQNQESWSSGQTTRLPLRRTRFCFPLGSLPYFRNVGIVPDDAASQRVFSGISRFLSPCTSAPPPYSPCFALIGSQDIRLCRCSSESIVYIQNSITPLDCQRIKQYVALSEDCEASRAEDGKRRSYTVGKSISKQSSDPVIPMNLPYDRVKRCRVRKSSERVNEDTQQFVPCAGTSQCSSCISHDHASRAEISHCLSVEDGVHAVRRIALRCMTSLVPRGGGGSRAPHVGRDHADGINAAPISGRMNDFRVNAQTYWSSFTPARLQVREISWARPSPLYKPNDAGCPQPYVPACTTSYVTRRGELIHGSAARGTLHRLSVGRVAAVPHTGATTVAGELVYNMVAYVQALATYHATAVRLRVAQLVVYLVYRCVSSVYSELLLYALTKWLYSLATWRTFSSSRRLGSSHLKKEDHAFPEAEQIRYIAPFVPARLPPWRTGFDSRWGPTGNIAGRCRWSAGFHKDLTLTLPFHSGAATYSPRLTLISSQDPALKSTLRENRTNICFRGSAPVLEHDDCDLGWREEGDAIDSSSAPELQVDPHRAGWHKLGEVRYGVEHGLLVELVRLGVDDDRRVDCVVGPVGPSVHVQRHVPVHPARHPVADHLSMRHCSQHPLLHITSYKPYHMWDTTYKPYHTWDTSYKPYHMWDTSYKPYHMWDTSYRPYHMWDTSYKPYHMRDTSYKPYHMWDTSYKPYHMWDTSYKPYHMRDTSYKPYHMWDTSYRPYHMRDTSYKPYHM
ncbi:hypothetical protein PR048_004058 [Dryococelus australis]|uniref:Uncharacterized protein n=1 Tax=Dryococelus australis TaxID=614101 RepID=A0ABQ9I4H8_9NEOP|nr:hypothetical protein PR048_004058 [Dryococelus australis]